MTSPLTSAALGVLTLLSLAAAVVGWTRRGGFSERLLVAAVLLGSGALYLTRWLATTGRWQPVAAHVDGLLLIAALLAAATLYVSTRPRLSGLTRLATPPLTLLLAWGVCAATWTYRPFGEDSLHPVWQAIHLAGVYTGTLGCTVAAVAGGGVPAQATQAADRPLHTHPHPFIC